MLFDLLGDSPADIRADDVSDATTAHLLNLWDAVPWRLECLDGNDGKTAKRAMIDPPAWQMPSEAVQDDLRRHLERLKESQTELLPDADEVLTTVGRKLRREEFTDDDRPTSEWAALCQFSDETFRNRMDDAKPGKTWRIVRMPNGNYIVHLDDLPDRVRGSKRIREDRLKRDSG